MSTKNRSIKSTLPLFALAASITPGVVKPAFGAAAPKKSSKKAEKPAEEEKPADEAKEVKPPKPTKLKFTKTTAKLGDLVFSHKLQPREKLNDEAVKDYTEQAKAAKEKGADSPFPALTVVKRGGELLVVSGYHRGAALKKAGYEETAINLAEADEITDGELFRLAIAENKEHGARLTNADKLHNLHKILKFPEYAELSNNALVDIVGASEFFIRQHRPASASPAVRKSKSGKSIKTGRIGKKGGKATKKSEEKSSAAGGTADAPEIPGLGDEGGGAPAGTPSGETKKGGLDEDAERALARISNLLDGHLGFTSKGIRDAVEQGTLKLSNSDLKVWATTSDARVKQIAPLVVSLGWSPKKAFAHIDKEIDGNTKVDHLVNSAIAGGGVLKRNSICPGETIVDNPTFTVVVFDNTKFDLAVTPKK